MTEFVVAIPRLGATPSELENDARRAQRKSALFRAAIGQSLHLTGGCRTILRSGQIWSRFIGDMFRGEIPKDLAGRQSLSVNDFIRAATPAAAGGYILYLHDQASGQHWFYRDPSGREACYHLTSERFHFVFSDLNALRHFYPGRLELDARQLARTLVFRDLREECTCIAGISEILPGQGLKIDGDCASSFQGWNPWAHVGHDGVNPDDHATILAQAIDSTVSDIAATRSGIIVELSGGLDSSILAASLHRSGTDFSTLTLVPFGPDGDERAYAEAVAGAFGCRSYVRFPTATHVDLEVSAARHLPRPAAKAFTQAFDVIGMELAAEIDGDLYLNGGGGDTVLGYFHSAAPVLDCWQQQGLSVDLIRSAANIAAITEVTIWEVLSSALRRRLQKMPRPTWKVFDQFLAADVAASVTARPSHPWLDHPADALPGKIFQISSLIGIYNYLDGTQRGRRSPLVFPLLSQPVLEAALAIPSWMSCSQGRNRSVARAAYANSLPPAITRRRSKGGFDGLCFDIFTTNRSLIESRLMDGYLAQQTIIDREAVAGFFKRGAIPSGTEINRLLAFIDIEAWISSLGTRTR